MWIWQKEVVLGFRMSGEAKVSQLSQVNSAQENLKSHWEEKENDKEPLQGSGWQERRHDTDFAAVTQFYLGRGEHGSRDLRACSS